eukprot:TRINITY_DN26016_c0_g1_i1.p1 TRINITY_DN26016_c0_g1~~TRINITY_DN26016_c0_g1_i1.p1  ORF type:complete len:1210 (+),score=254.90 TRINITY_DN26016_c0_g1_i1:69-3698(+)
MGDEEQPGDCVKVAIRLRPPSSKEIGNGEKCIIEIKANDGGSPGTVTISDPAGKEKDGEFAFDIVFGIQTEQPDVFDKVGKEALSKCMVGYNGTIFAYGQTGSGKSWCMMGAQGELRGIIPRVNDNLFEQIRQLQAEVITRKFLVMCSFFEIYNEIIFDLLNPVQDRGTVGAGLQVKEHPVLGVYVKDLQEIVTADADGLVGLMEKGTKNRAVSCTNMNSVSSRSHSIFIIKVHQKDDEDKSKNVFAKLNLVDLAGSERQKGTGASGQTLKEGANINKSLSALGNVINALVENANGKKTFVPFRNSKLTRVLQESLGGNSLTTMLATLSPAACNYEETLSTLRYANRAKAIKISATKNEEASQISRLNAEIEELKKKLAKGGAGVAVGGGSGMLASDEREEIRTKFEQQLKDMESMVNSTWEEKARISKENEAQLGKALDEHKRQAKAMREELRNRFRMLQDQNDLEFTIRGLLDTVQSLPTSKEPSTSPRACAPLLSGEVPRQWLKRASEIAEVVQTLKQEKTMALVFQGAFQEDMRLWVDGLEASDHGMARAGARRGLTKLGTLRRECLKLGEFESQGQTRAKEFATAVHQLVLEWANGGAERVAKELRETADQNGANELRPPERDGDGKSGVQLPSLHEATVEDIGRIIQLVENQASIRATEISSLSAMEVRTTSDLVLRGLTVVKGAATDPADVALIEVHAGATGGKAKFSAVTETRSREHRPIYDWGPDDADTSVEGAEFALSQIISLDAFKKKRTAQELLGRPPPKFVHDVALLIREATGLLPTMTDEWPEAREGKLAVLQQIKDTVTSILGAASFLFDPADVLKGKEVPSTLKLLQLIAIAGAKHKRQISGDCHESHIFEIRAEDEASLQASEMPKYLDALVRCIQSALEHQEKVKATMCPEGTVGSPSRVQNSGIRAIYEKIEEEQKICKRQEERVKALQQELTRTRSTVKERSVQLAEAQKKAADAESTKQGLRRQIEVLRSGLMQMAMQMGSSNAVIAEMRQALEETTSNLSRWNSKRSCLRNDVTRQQQQQLEAESVRETLEMDLKRMRLRLAEGLNTTSDTVDEEILALQAEKQKLDVKAASLEEKLRLMSESDDSERQREHELREEKGIQSGKNDDFQMQLQVIIEERDALREGMDQLWQRKSMANEELDNVTLGYTHLSDRVMEKTDEYRELEERLEEYENLRVMLLQNIENTRK